MNNDVLWNKNGLSCANVLVFSDFRPFFTNKLVKKDDFSVD